MIFENALTALGLLGVGGFAGTYLRILWERKKEAQLHKQEFKETRYKCVILLMYAALDFKTHVPFLRQHGYRFDNIDELHNELKAEWHNMILFASEEVLVSVHEFIRTPSVERFRKSALAMRADLWGGKVSNQILNLDFTKIEFT